MMPTVASKKDDAMDECVVWVHGIGPTEAGYSDSWTQVYNECLNFPTTAYIEVLWADVYSSATNTITLPLVMQEQLAEAQVRKNLTTVLLARVTALAQNPAWLDERAQITHEGATSRELPIWVVNSEDYIGQFVKYLVNSDIRDAVKEKMKEQLRPLAESCHNISLIAHSWGTVVAYESLLDLESELPELQIAHLFTLGSPLWLVQNQLEDTSGRKPGNVTNWVNIHARGDPIGAGLAPAFEVDADYPVAGVGDGAPHGSYFAPGNVAVQCDIVAATILGKPVEAVNTAAAVEVVPTTPEAPDQK
jgi:metacaspase-1